MSKLFIITINLNILAGLQKTMLSVFEQTFTPVISFKTGGMPDHVRNFETGLLAEEISAESLADTIRRFVENKKNFNRQSIREYAEKHFNEKLIAGKYIEVYNRIDR